MRVICAYANIPMSHKLQFVADSYNRLSSLLWIAGHRLDSLCYSKRQSKVCRTSHEPV